MAIRPKFADMKVAVLDAKKETIVEKVPAARNITIQDLFRHTNGLSYGGRGTTAVHKLYPESSGQAAAEYTGTQFVDHLATLPLHFIDLGLRLRPRRSRASRGAPLRADAGRLSPRQLVQAAWYGRQLVPDPG